MIHATKYEEYRWGGEDFLLSSLPPPKIQVKSLTSKPSPDSMLTTGTVVSYAPLSQNSLVLTAEQLKEIYFSEHAKIISDQKSALFGMPSDNKTCYEPNNSFTPGIMYYWTEGWQKALEAKGRNQPFHIPASWEYEITLRSGIAATGHRPFHWKIKNLPSDIVSFKINTKGSIISDKIPYSNLYEGLEYIFSYEWCKEKAQMNKDPVDPFDLPKGYSYQFISAMDGELSKYSPYKNHFWIKNLCGQNVRRVFRFKIIKQ